MFDKKNNCLCCEKEWKKGLRFSYILFVKRTDNRQTNVSLGITYWAFATCFANHSQCLSGRETREFVNERFRSENCGTPKSEQTSRCMKSAVPLWPMSPALHVRQNDGFVESSRDRNQQVSESKCVFVKARHLQLDICFVPERLDVGSSCSDCLQRKYHFAHPKEESCVLSKV